MICPCVEDRVTRSLMAVSLPPWVMSIDWVFADETNRVDVTVLVDQKATRRRAWKDGVERRALEDALKSSVLVHRSAPHPYVCFQVAPDGTRRRRPELHDVPDSTIAARVRELHDRAIERIVAEHA